MVPLVIWLGFMQNMFTTNAGEGVELSLPFPMQRPPNNKTFVYPLLYLHVGISGIMGLKIATVFRVDNDLHHIDLFFLYPHQNNYQYQIRLLT
jgi:hypothetical protein